MQVDISEEHNPSASNSNSVIVVIKTPKIIRTRDI